MLVYSIQLLLLKMYFYFFVINPLFKHEGSEISFVTGAVNSEYIYIFLLLILVIVNYANQ